MTIKTKYKNNISKCDRINIGVSAVAGDSVSQIANDFNTNRVFVYDQKNKVLKVLDENFDINKSIPIATISNENHLKRTIISTALSCKGSVRGIQQHLNDVFDISVSTGKISGILTEAAISAKKFNDSIMLDVIKKGAHDEIFQAGVPVLVGVEPMSTYIYLMEFDDKRDKIAWSMAMYEKHVNQNLNLETSVTDGGLGMKSGIKEVFEEMNEQSDIFHIEMNITKLIRTIENNAYRSIKFEYENRTKCLKEYNKIGTKNESEDNYSKAYEEYEKAVKESNKKIDFYDTLNIIGKFIKETFDIGGYTFSERKELLKYLTGELKKLSIIDSRTGSIANNIESNMDNILLFVKEAEQQMDILAQVENIDKEILQLMWKQNLYSINNNKYWILDVVIRKALKKNYENIREKFKAIVNKLVRASSIVECMNSLIRPYIELKKTLKGNFLDLLQFYLNNRKYSASRKEDRKGKSPLELLTGKDYPCWLDILGY